MTDELVDFEDIKEIWGTKVRITEGEFKGYFLEFKIICERVYVTGEKDDVGLPRFKVSHHTVIRVLPPEKVKE